MLPTSDGASLWYRITGAGPDTVLVPLGAYLERALAPLGVSHVMVFYDPRGRGRSAPLADTSALTFGDGLRDLATVQEALGVHRAAVIGFSAQAATAVSYAAAHPDRVSRLVLLSPIEPNDSLARAWDPPERRTRIDTTMARTLLKLRAAGRDTSDAAEYCRTYWMVNAPLFVGDPSRTGVVDAAWCAEPNETPRSLGAHQLRLMESLGPGRDFAPVARRVGVPVLVVQGGHDLIVNPAGAAAWARLLPDGRLLMFADAGDFLFLEEPDLVRDAIGRFLGGVWPDRAVREP